MSDETIPNTIDAAISSCEKKIERHRGEAKNLLRIIILTLMFFALIQGFSFVLNSINQNKVTSFVEHINELSDKLDSNVQKNTLNLMAMSSLIKEYASYSRRAVEDTGFQNVIDKRGMYQISKGLEMIYDSTTIKKIESDNTLSNLKKLPSELKSDLFKIDNTAIYIFYGIFILVFGVMTSFYRFHLKEISKFEHFLFGYERIRIAGNNSTTKYDDEVKTALTKDAFAYESKAPSNKENKIQSPIEGHPTSDIGTAILNKMLESINFKATPKD